MPDKLSKQKIKRIRILRKRGLKYTEIARRLDISTATVRGYALYESPTEYNNQLLEKWGFNSNTEYRKYLEENRLDKNQKQELKNKLSELISKRLQELGKSQGWLSREIGVEKQTISLYVHKKTLPKHNNAEKIFSALKINSEYSCLEDLLEE
jgi:ribosome-binding protein aMBF1 (putative translation factor)